MFWHLQYKYFGNFMGVHWIILRDIGLSSSNIQLSMLKCLYRSITYSVSFLLSDQKHRILSIVFRTESMMIVPLIRVM